MSSIPLVALSVRPPDVLDQYKQGVSLRSLQDAQNLQRQAAPLQLEQQRQATQQAQIATQQAQQQQAQTQAINNAYHDALTTDPSTNTPTIDSSKLSKSLAAAGHGSAIPAIVKSVNDYQSSVADYQKKSAEVQQLTNDINGSVGNAIKQANYDPQVADLLIEHRMQDPGLPPQSKATLQQVRQSIQANPDIVKSIADNLIAGSAKQQELQAQTTKANADRFKDFNGVVYDVSGKTPVPAVGAQADPQAWSDIVDKIIPPGPNAALNGRTKMLVNFYVKQGNLAEANKAISEAGQNLGTIEKETDPRVIGAAVNKAVAVHTGELNAEKKAVDVTQGLISVVDPQGNTHFFNDQAAANRFKQLAGIK